MYHPLGLESSEQKILLIEDNSSDAWVICKMLHQDHFAKFQTTCAGTLREGLNLLDKESFDAVILDLGLPDSQGVETMSVLRAKAGLAPAVVIATGLNDEMTGVEAVRRGAQDYLVKGKFNSELLVRSVQYAIERKKSENEIKKTVASLREMTLRLEESNRALQDFAFIASHDLQEPLRKVISFGGLLKQKYGELLGSEGGSHLDRMINATHRMQTLLSMLLDYSRVTMKAEPFREVDLTDIVHEALSDLEVRREKTGGDVDVGPLPSIAADPTQMRQLFQNLIANALKFHKEGVRPIVKVRARTEGHCHVISVEDNGIGFDEKHMEKIFAPFHRLHGRTSPYDGAGMGLAICKKIVDRHGGSITAKSAPGEGAVFTITLPLKQG
jgi:signal transduction histidine kinase